MPHWTPKMLGWLNREPDFSCILLFILAYIAAILIWLQNTLHDDILWYRWRVRCQVMNAEWGADGRVILRSTLRSSDPQHCKRYFFASIWFMDMSNLPPWSDYSVDQLIINPKPFSTSEATQGSCATPSAVWLCFSDLSPQFGRWETALEPCDTQAGCAYFHNAMDILENKTCHIFPAFAFDSVACLSLPR